MPPKEKSVLGEAIPMPQPSPRAQSSEALQRSEVRKKLMRFGARSLTNVELLSLILSAFRHHGGSRACAERLLADPGAEGITQIPPNRLVKEVQIGLTNACRLAAVIEFGRRFLVPSTEEPRVGSPAEAYALVRDLAKARKEHLVALYLDAQNRLITRETVSIGSLNTTRTHPREVLQPGIVNSALAFILVHNHPSGSLDASRDDIEFTRTMAKAGDLIGINLYDHLIVSSRGFISLKEKGFL